MGNNNRLPRDRWILMIAGGFSGHRHQKHYLGVEYSPSNTETELFMTGACLNSADFVVHWKRSSN